MHHDVLCLSKVASDHLLKKDLYDAGFFLNIEWLEQFPEGQEVYQIGRINRPIQSVHKVAAWLLSTQYTAVLNIIDNQACCMQILYQSSDLDYSLIELLRKHLTQ